MKKGRWIFAGFLVLLMTFSILRRLPGRSSGMDQVKTEQAGKDRGPGNGGIESPERLRGQGAIQSPEQDETRGTLNRNVSRIIYTRHARCRMGCRMIDAGEVEEILKQGTINYQKSDLRSSPDPKYALEGMTHDGQQVRIVFANSPRGPVVVTVIDLGRDWPCDCK